MVMLNMFSGNSLTNNTYPTKAEFVATIQQVYGDRATYRDMQGKPASIDELTQGQLWIDGEYTGFWGIEAR